ncbi:phage tail protein [Novosphingobium sp. 9]|uniref:phage tail protein n=1 Tax=Novosphingobium sp. 9 TaxID=2025349 RepID=UPI0021B66D3F|nr:phage tail protein [Novosphingobium sp. 9]
MRKIDTLRTAILAALPELNRDPDRIKVWIERGTGKSTQTDGRSLVFAFQLNVLILKMTTDISVLALAVFNWLRSNQPELMVPGVDGFTFDADFLDNGTAEVLIQLTIDQGVTVTPKTNGGYDLVWADEPDPLFADLFGDSTDNTPPSGTIDGDVLPPWES